MEFENFNSEPDFDNLLKDYPEDEQHKYRIFVRDSDDDHWYELDFPRFIKDTLKVNKINCCRFEIRRKDNITESFKPYDIDEILYELHKLKCLTSEPDEKDIHYIVSYLTYEKSKYMVKDLSDDEKAHSDHINKLYESYSRYYYGRNKIIIDMLSEGPFDKEEFDKARNRVANCRNIDGINRKITLNDAIEKDLVKPISESKYKLIVCNLHQLEILKGLKEDIEKNASQDKIKTWKQIHQQVIDIYTEKDYNINNNNMTVPSLYDILIKSVNTIR